MWRAVATPAQLKVLAEARRPHHRRLERLSFLARSVFGRQWRAGLRTYLSVPEDRLAAYERGEREIPEALLTRLAALPTWRPRENRPVWDVHMQKQLKEMVEAGADNGAIAQALEVPLKSVNARAAPLRGGRRKSKRVLSTRGQVEPQA
jgi:hypothetical protein